MTTLYALDAKGELREWSIYVDDDEIVTRYGQLNGALTEHREVVSENKSGRDLDQQIDLMYDSKINKKIDSGYIDTIEKALNGRTNSMGFKKPMLAKVLKPNNEIHYSLAFVQRKYDGNRCMITNVNGEIIAYTRNGKPIKTIDHITSRMSIPEGMTIDGELYCHGERLQTIVSWIKRNQESTKNLRYHAYDCVTFDPFDERLERLKSLSLGENAVVAETEKVSNYESVIDLFRTYREEGYEGAILRTGYRGYEDGKRSKSLLKLKEWHDCECKVIDIFESKDGWAIIKCLFSDNGKTFRCSAPGDVREKKLPLNFPSEFLGKYVTVEYANLTKDGVPFHPIAKCWRTQ